MTPNRNYLISLIVTILLSFSRFSNAEEIRVVGSDFVGAALNLEVENGQKLGPYNVSYKMTGSLIGLLKLEEGYADVAFVLDSENGAPMNENFSYIPIGFFGVYFVVNDENPLSEVKTDSLAEIILRSRDGLRSEWGGLLPGEPIWANRLVFVTFDISENDPSYPLLVKNFFGNEVPERFSSIGERIENPYAASPSNLLIMSRLPELSKGIRPLALIESGQEVGYTPSAESLYFGDYSLSTSLSLVVRNKHDPKVKAFLEDFFASDGPQLLKNAGLVSVPENVQKQALLEFDLDF